MEESQTSFQRALLRCSDRSYGGTCAAHPVDLLTAHFQPPEPSVSTGGLAPGEFLSGGPPGAVVFIWQSVLW